MSISSPSARLISRRTAALFALGVALVTLLLISWHSTAASADPYPPSGPSSTTTFQIDPSSEHRTATSATSSDADTNSTDGEGLSSTGFQTLAATTIAVALLGGGAIFLGLGRRRRHG